MNYRISARYAVSCVSRRFQTYSTSAKTTGSRGIWQMSIAEVNSLMESGGITPLDLVQACTERIKLYDDHVNAFIEISEKDRVQKLAEQSGKRIRDGRKRSPLDGIPIAIKDNFCTSELKTTCASAMLKDFQPPFNATVVELLINAGAIILGKTNMDEFGMGSETIHSHFGKTRNPYNTQDLKNGARIAGGSSGGSAASVASGMCFAALGSDTGGSVRLPASYCGIVGFKPSYGRCSRWGLVAYANSLDTVGILARTVEDTRLLYNVLSTYDEKDTTSIPSEIFQQDSHVPIRTDSLNSIRVGVPESYFVSELDTTIVTLWKKAIDYLNHRGATIIPVSCPSTQYALPAYYVLAPAEASSNLARYDGIRYGSRCDNVTETDETLYAATRDEGFGEEVKRRIILGTYTLTEGSYSDCFLQAQKVRQLIKKDFDAIFAKANPLNGLQHTDKAPDGVDVLITPVTISTAPKITEVTNVEGRNAVEAYVNDVMTIPASLAGIPAISIPFGISPKDGYPIGLQLLAQYGDEQRLLHVASVLEEGSDINT